MLFGRIGGKSGQENRTTENRRTRMSIHPTGSCGSFRSKDRKDGSGVQEFQDALPVVRSGIKGCVSVSDVHIQTEVGPLIQLLGDLHCGIGIQNGILEDAHGQHGTAGSHEAGT